MAGTEKPSIRLDVSYAQGVWQVIVFNGDQTEHKSFLTQAEARKYGAARLAYLLSQTEEIRLDRPPES